MTIFGTDSLTHVIPHNLLSHPLTPAHFLGIFRAINTLAFNTPSFVSTFGRAEIRSATL